MSNDDTLKKIKQAAKDKRVVFTSQERVKADEVRARIVLKAISEVAESPNMFYAWISDESHIGDFFPFEEDYEECCRQVGELLKLDLSDVQGEKGYIVNLAARLITEDLDEAWVTSGGMFKAKGRSKDAPGDSSESTP